MKRLALLVVTIFFLICASSQAYWTPQQHLTWYWQLQGTVNNNENVNAYDIDGFENTSSEVSLLHSQGKRAICYIDVGTAENFRPDYSEFPTADLGNTNGWPGERWLNITDPALHPIMEARFKMCAEKGFDAVEPDNMDGFENNSGFPLTAAEQATYDEWIATTVHSLNMSVFQKNDSEQSAQFQPYFDGAIDEQCNQYNECNELSPYLKAGKPVLNAEYSLSTSKFCAADNAAGIMGAKFDLELDGKTFEPCWTSSVEELPIVEEKPVEKPKEEKEKPKEEPKEEEHKKPTEEKHKKHHEEEERRRQEERKHEEERKHRKHNR